jgi:hypothetical protein
MPECKPLDTERTLKDAADWLRHKNLDPNTVDDATLGALQNMAGVELLHSKISALEKKKFMDSALSWLRANKDNLGDMDDFTVQALADIAGISLPLTT